MSEKIPCTVEILTHNSGKTLRRALESVKDFTDIIVVDGASTDDTLTIAHEYGAHIIPQDPQYLEADGRIKDFAAIRNQGLEAASQPWFFFLDSDEYLSPELIEEIRTLSVMNTQGAYWVSRMYIYQGTRIDCATTYPNRSMRFFTRVSAEQFIKKVHERIKLKDAAHVAMLNAPLLVPFDTDLTNGRKKDAHYLVIERTQLRTVPFLERVRITFRTLAISMLYFLRLIRIQLFCHGARLPLVFELERYRYNALYIVALWRSVFTKS